MAKERKIKCDCGTLLELKDTLIEHIPAEALVCPKCGFTTLTKEQARDFIRNKDFHKLIDQEKKIIKIGNSMGITLPEELHSFGVSIGSKVRLEAIDKNSFKVEIL